MRIKKRIYRKWFVREANIDGSGGGGIWVKKMFGVERVTVLFLYEKFQRYPFYYSRMAVHAETLGWKSSVRRYRSDGYRRFDVITSILII